MKIEQTPELNEAFDLLADSLESSMEESENFNEYLYNYELGNLNHSYKDSRLLDYREYISNPYLKLFANVNVTKNNIKFTKNSYKKFQSFLYNDTLANDEDFEEINFVGHFDRNFEYPVIYKGKTPWMSIVPHEINTMKKAIEDASGDVITFGCGLGYYAFMVSNKETVTSVTIVESDPNVLSIFNEMILPKFPNKNKIKVICGDCYKFADSCSKKYDYLFIDTYHTPEDGLPMYVKLQKYLDKISKQSSFWIEDSIVTYFRRYIILGLIDLYSGNIKFEEFASFKGDVLDEIIGRYMTSLKDITIKNTEDLQGILKSSAIKEQFKKI